MAEQQSISIVLTEPELEKMLKNVKAGGFNEIRIEVIAAVIRR